MLIKKYKNKYLQQCISLFISVFNAPPWNDQWTLKSAREYLANIIKTPGFAGYTGFHDNNLTAVCLGRIKAWYKNREYFIEEFFVDNENQRSGYGTELLNHVQNDLSAGNIKSVTLITGKNTPANTFYEKNGFYTLESFVLKSKKLP